MSEILKKIEEAAKKEMEEFALKYPKDIGLLYSSYTELLKQNWSEEFLKGYLSCISDLIIIKKGHWHG